LPRTPHPLAASAIAVSSYPEARSLGCDRRWIFEATRISHPSAPLVREVPGCPGSLRDSRCLRCRPRVSPLPAPSGFYRRSTLEATRELNASAVPRGRFRVAPYSGASVSPTTSDRVSPVLHLPAPVDEAPRVASVRSPSGFARENFRVTPNLLWSLAPPTVLAPVRPGASVLRRCRGTHPRFAPVLCSSAWPSMFPRVAPIHIYGWVDDESRLFSNFASSACTADESSSSVRLCSLAGKRRCFNFFRVFAIGKPTTNSRCPLTLHR